jgi:uncharacterized protein YkwD
MRLLISILLFTAVSHPLFARSRAPLTDAGVSSRAIIQEMNLARQNPALYASFIEQLRGTLDGNSMLLPGHTRLRTKEGTAALDDAIRFLRSTQPQAPLSLSPGMSRAAADHCAEQASGGFGHGGNDFSNPAGRIGRYGQVGGGWGENISYGKTTAREIVLVLIIDDGQPARKHRKNIFNPNFNVAGAAFGRHARFGTVCSIEFAGGYVEQGQARVETARPENSEQI